MKLKSATIFLVLLFCVSKSVQMENIMWESEADHSVQTKDGIEIIDNIKVSDGLKIIDKPVNFTIYYLNCHARSREFIMDQLYPTIVQLSSMRLRPDVFLGLVPYLEGETESEMVSKCLEDVATREACLSSKIQACASDIFDRNIQSKLDFLLCHISNCYKTLQECLPTDKSQYVSCYDKERLRACINSVDGDVLLAAMTKDIKQLGVALTQEDFPLVTIDNVYSRDEQQKARKNLLGVLCEKYPSQLKESCDKPRVHREMKHENFNTEYVVPRLGCTNW